MPTVYGMHLDRARDAIGSSIISGFINGVGHLILTAHDGTEIDAGVVNESYSGGTSYNPDAVVNATVNGSNELVLTQHDGSTINLGVVGGGSNPDAVVNAVINASDELVLIQDDGGTINLGVVGGGVSEHTHDLPYIILGPTDPVPADTAEGMLIFRTE